MCVQSFLTFQTCFTFFVGLCETNTRLDYAQKSHKSDANWNFDSLLRIEVFKRSSVWNVLKLPCDEHEIDSKLKNGISFHTSSLFVFDSKFNAGIHFSWCTVSHFLSIEIFKTYLLLIVLIS